MHKEKEQGADREEKRKRARARGKEKRVERERERITERGGGMERERGETMTHLTSLEYMTFNLMSTGNYDL